MVSMRVFRVRASKGKQSLEAQVQEKETVSLRIEEDVALLLLVTPRVAQFGLGGSSAYPSRRINGEVFQIESVLDPRMRIRGGRVDARVNTCDAEERSPKKLVTVTVNVYGTSASKMARGMTKSPVVAEGEFAMTEATTSAFVASRDVARHSNVSTLPKPPKESRASKVVTAA
jgi:hypothetical protein